MHCKRRIFDTIATDRAAIVALNQLSAASLTVSFTAFICKQQRFGKMSRRHCSASIPLQTHTAQCPRSQDEHIDRVQSTFGKVAACRNETGTFFTTDSQRSHSASHIEQLNDFYCQIVDSDVFAHIHMRCFLSDFISN